MAPPAPLPEGTKQHSQGILSSKRKSRHGSIWGSESSRESASHPLPAAAFCPSASLCHSSQGCSDCPAASLAQSRAGGWLRAGQQSGGVWAGTVAGAGAGGRRQEDVTTFLLALGLTHVSGLAEEQQLHLPETQSCCTPALGLSCCRQLCCRA